MDVSFGGMVVLVTVGLQGLGGATARLTDRGAVVTGDAGLWDRLLAVLLLSFALGLMSRALVDLEQKVVAA